AAIAQFKRSQPEANSLKLLREVSWFVSGRMDAPQFLSQNDFAHIVRFSPLVSIDLIIRAFRDMCFSASERMMGTDLAWPSGPRAQGASVAQVPATYFFLPSGLILPPGI